MAAHQVRRKVWDVQPHKRGAIHRILVDESRDRMLSCGMDGNIKCCHVLSGGERWSQQVGPVFALDRFRGLVLAPESRRGRNTLHCIDVEVRMAHVLSPYSTPLICGWRQKAAAVLLFWCAASH